MTSRSQRFGPRIGGWRGSSPVLTEQRFTNADIAATPYLARWSRQGVSTQYMVLALDEDQAAECARLRAASLGDDVSDDLLDLTPMPRASQETYRAILEAESAEEYALRNRGRER